MARDKLRQTKTNNKCRRERTKRRLSAAKAQLGGVCVICGTTEALQFDHIDPKTKLFNISIGAGKASEQDFWLEVAKCQLLCIQHHKEKCLTDGSGTSFGETHGMSKLRELDIRYVRELHRMGHTMTAIADEFQVSRMTISRILSGKTWKHVR